jgi:hypothetical protein
MNRRVLTFLLFGLIALPIAGQKKVVVNPSRPIQEQLAKSDTRYVFKNPIDLQGSNLLIPDGCILEFRGKGLLSNGTLTGNETMLKRPKLQKIRFNGTFANELITINNSFDAEFDFWNFIKCFPYADILLSKDIILPDAPEKDMTIHRLHINGEGHTITVCRCPILRDVDVWLKNITFDCTRAQEFIIYALGITPEHRFSVCNCKFINVPEAMSLCPRAYSQVLIEGCSITGILDGDSRRTKEYISQILVYACNGRIIVRNNTLKNCFGIGINGIGYKPNEQATVLVEGNTIDYVANGGIVFSGGEVWNATVRNNHISHTHALGKQFDGEIDGGPNSAINFHGFYNVLIENNTIDNCPNSSSFDFDGSLSGKTGIEKGTGLVVQNNIITRSGGIAFFVVQDVKFANNTLQSANNADDQHYFDISGSRNLIIHGNNLKLNKGRAKKYYPIYITDTKTVKCGKIKIGGNVVSTDGQHFVFINAAFTGECQIEENTVRSSGSKDGTLSVVNNSKTIIELPKKSKLVRYK